MPLDDNDREEIRAIVREEISKCGCGDSTRIIRAFDQAVEHVNRYARQARRVPIPVMVQEPSSSGIIDAVASPQGT